MLLPRTDPPVGAEAAAVPVEQPAVGRRRLCVAGGDAEPAVPAELLLRAVPAEQVEGFRALLPVGYTAGVEAYRAAVNSLTVRDLSEHYTRGLGWFRAEFIPRLKAVLRHLSGGVWELDEFDAFAAGSDVDFMTHLVGAVSARSEVCLYPGDWYGFRVGCTHPERVLWTADSVGRLACLCVPSVRNGHLTEEMASFLEGADACLLNLNLFPTLPPLERKSVAEALLKVLGKSVLSISFSRGFGLTASQLGVALVPRDHPYRRLYQTAWEWLTYFHNALAARAFLELDLTRLETVDCERRAWVGSWLKERGLPLVNTGSYYVRSFRPVGGVPERLAPLARDGVVRFCFKPPAS